MITQAGIRRVTKEAFKLIVLTAFTILWFSLSAFAGWDEGVAAFTSKNYRVAVKEFTELVKQNPDGWKGHYMLGLSFYKLKQKAKAQTHLRKAYDLNPNDLSIKVALARIIGDYSNGNDAYQVLKTSNPEKLPSFNQKLGISTENEVAAYYYLLGTAALKLGKQREGKLALKKASELEPGNRTYQRAYKAANE